ncbi:MAG: hypothetical protein QOJ50_802 [Cryptosporangiaceae bacterium]|nr:hypothetical protein [Cryptosporangiaceae bacterium]
MVLLAAADPVVRDLLGSSLRFEGYHVVAVEDSERALDAISRRRPDLVLLGVQPGGIAACQALRADPVTAALPVILLGTGSLTTDTVLALAAGADDYVALPFDTTELLARVRSKLVRNREIRGASPLTGLPGNNRILAEIADRVAGPDEYAVCYVDLDNFKTVNDVYGFYRGDQLIVALAAALHGAAAAAEGRRPFLGHIGGDDFLVVCTPEQVGTVTERTIARFAELSRPLYDEADAARGYFEISDRQGRLHRRGLVTISIGVALSTQRAYTDHREVVAVASEMKQVAKRSPGSVVAVDRRRDREPGRGATARSLRESIHGRAARRHAADPGGSDPARIPATPTPEP